MRRRRRITVVAALLALGGVLAFAAPADAITPTISEINAGTNGLPSNGAPQGMAAGPDGNLWFTDLGATPHAIGRINPSTYVVNEFTTGLNPGASPLGIAAGADGNLWFTDFNGTMHAVGRITPAGAIIEFNDGANGLDAGSNPFGIVAGADGNLWFTDQGDVNSMGHAIGRITPCAPLPCAPTIKQFSIGTSLPQFGIASGADGNVWFTVFGGGSPTAIEQITPAGAITPFSEGLNTGSRPSGIGAGADGNLWFTDQGTTSALGRITPAGAITEFTAGLASVLVGIAAGPDGGLWFSDNTGGIGRIDPATGAISEFNVGLNAGGRPAEIVAGADGNMWFTDIGSTGAIGRITTPPTAVTVTATTTGPTSATVAGTANGHAQATSFRVEYGPLGGATTTTPEQGLGTTTGDTPVSVALIGLTPGTAYQARVVVTNPTDTTPGVFRSFTTAGSPPVAVIDRIGRVSIAPDTFAAAAKGPPVVAARHRKPKRKTGAIVSYSGTAPATTVLTVQRPAAGRRSGHKCAKPTNRNRKHRRCTRYPSVGGFTHADTAGVNRFRFTGRVRGHKLWPGTYRLQAIPRNTAGTGPAAYRQFRIRPARLRGDRAPGRRHDAERSRVGARAAMTVR